LLDSGVEREEFTQLESREARLEGGSPGGHTFGQVGKRVAEK